MFRKLKEYSVNKITDKNLKNRDLSDVNARLNTLGFLIDETVCEDFEMLYGYGDLLGIAQKDIKLFSFLDYKKSTPSLRQNQVNEKDFTWEGDLKSASAKEFLNKSFDVLIGYYNGRNSFLDLMVSQSRAKFKIGGMGADKRLFDLLIAVEVGDVETFKDEIKKYLTVLNKI